jgi:hypothetical protein
MAQKTKLIIQVEDGIDVDVVHFPAHDPTKEPVIGTGVPVEPATAPTSQPYKKGYRWNAAGCLTGNSLCS